MVASVRKFGTSFCYGYFCVVSDSFGVFRDGDIGVIDLDLVSLFCYFSVFICLFIMSVV